MESGKNRLRELLIELVEDQQRDVEVVELVNVISRYIHGIGCNNMNELLHLLFTYSCVKKVDLIRMDEIQRLTLLLGSRNNTGEEFETSSNYSYNSDGYCDDYCPYEYDAIVPLDEPREVKLLPHSKELDQRGVNNEITIIPRRVNDNHRWVIEPSIDSYMIDVIDMHIHPRISHAEVVEVVNNVIERAVARENHTTPPPPIILDNIDLKTKRAVGILPYKESIGSGDCTVIIDRDYKLVIEPPIVGIPLDIIHDIHPRYQQEIESHIVRLLEKYSKKQDEYREYKSKLVESKS